MRCPWLPKGNRIVARLPIAWVGFSISMAYGVFFFFAPFVLVLSFSLHARDYYGGVTHVFSAEGWHELFTSVVRAVVVRSAIMATMNTALCCLIGIPLSIAICATSFRVRRLWLAMLILPTAINTLLIAYGWQALLGNAGVINGFLISAGLRREPFPMLFTPSAIMLGLVASYLPFFIIAFMSSLDRVDPGYVAASYTLGASRWQTLWKVLLPLARPGLVAGALLVFLPSFAEYIIPDLLGGGKVFLVGSLIQYNFYEGCDWPMAAALVMMTVVLLICFMLPTMRYLRGSFLE
jgi:ABC-type spermidine/putrescine transport system permease subunit I